MCRRACMIVPSCEKSRHDKGEETASVEAGWVERERGRRGQPACSWMAWKPVMVPAVIALVCDQIAVRVQPSPAHSSLYTRSEPAASPDTSMYGSAPGSPALTENVDRVSPGKGLEEVCATRRRQPVWGRVLAWEE